MGDDFEHEFGFELRTCRWAELDWPPDGERPDDVAVVVARQLGTRQRRWDTIVVEADREALEARAAFGERGLDSNLLHVVRNAPAEWAWYRDALPYPGYPWRYVREAIHEAADRGVVETRRVGNRIEICRIAPYPDWVRRIIAVENKPDLDASAARDLAPQLQQDVALGLADEVWVATATTGERVEPILLEDVPVQAGILTLDFGTGNGTDEPDPSEPDPAAPIGGRANVQWLPRTLAIDEPGVRILSRASGGEYDDSATEFEYVPPEEKAEMRLALAERAYGRGWRSYAESMRPDCRHFALGRDGPALVPHCRAKACEPTPRECRHSCPSFEPEPPAWRQKEWPIEGGPGKAVKRLLAERRRRQRDGLSTDRAVDG